MLLSYSPHLSCKFITLTSVTLGKRGLVSINGGLDGSIVPEHVWTKDSRVMFNPCPGASSREDRQWTGAAPHQKLGAYTSNGGRIQKEAERSLQAPRLYHTCIEG